MAPQLPYGAAEIVAMRTAGKRPAEMVLISLVGPLRETNPVVIAQPSRSYDWRFVVALPVVVIAETTTQHLASTVKAVEGDALLTICKHRHGDWEGRIQLWFDRRSQSYLQGPNDQPKAMALMAETDEVEF